MCSEWEWISKCSRTGLKNEQPHKQNTKEAPDKNSKSILGRKKPPKKVLASVSVRGLLNMWWQTGRNHIHAMIKSYEKKWDILQTESFQWLTLSALKKWAHITRDGTRQSGVPRTEVWLCVALRMACGILISWAPTLWQVLINQLTGVNVHW